MIVMPLGIGAGLIFDLGIIVVFATLLALLGKFLKQPSLIMYIIAGLIIGPIGLNLITDISIPLISELGIAFLLFAIGIETDFSKIKSFGKFIIIASIIQVISTMAAAFVGGRILGMDILSAVYLGLIVAFSSTAIVVKIFSDKKELPTLHAKILIGILLVQDFLVVIALPFLQNVSTFLSPYYLLQIVLSGVLLFVLALFLAKFIFPKLFSFVHSNEELLFLLAVSTCFVFIFASLSLGFSIAVGGFLAGLSLSSLIYNLELSSKINGLRDFFATVFFVSLGLQINISSISLNDSFSLGLILVILFSVFVFKPLSMFVLSMLNGFGGRNSLIVALSLAQISEFSFILASQALLLGVFSQQIFSLIVLITAVSMALTPYLINSIDSIHYFFKNKLNLNSKNSRFFSRIKPLEEISEYLKNHIVVFGAGVIGTALIDSLNANEIVIAVDNDPEIVLMHKSNGVQAILADASNTEILKKLNLKQAKLLISTIPDTKKSEFIISKAKEIHPKLTVFGRARTKEQALRLFDAGADFVILPEVIAGNEFVKNVLSFLETGKPKDASNLQEIFKQFLKEEQKQNSQKEFKL